MRREFVLDKKSNRLLNELAESRGGNRSRVIREAIVLFADQEAYLEKIESDPKFIEMMKRSAADIKAGRVSEQAEVEAALRGKESENSGQNSLAGLHRGAMMATRATRNGRLARR